MIQLRKKQKNPKHRALFFVLMFLFQIILYNCATLGTSGDVLDSEANLEAAQSPRYFINQTSHIEQWIKDPTLVTGTLTNWTSAIQGDENDLEVVAADDQLYYRILGEEQHFSLVADPPDDTTWTQTLNPNFPFYPDAIYCDDGGLWIYHLWEEGADQSPSVHWDYNVTMPHDMSEYEITSANVSMMVNATVHAPGTNGVTGQPGLEVPGDNPPQAATYDYIRWYVLVSDRDKAKNYEVAYYQTVDLGRDDVGTPKDYMEDTYIFQVPEESLKFYLGSVLNTDNQNFTISLGIRLWCEDNFPFDRDLFDQVYIRQFSLNFTYRKIIDRFTQGSWMYEGDELTAANFYEDNAEVEIVLDNATFFYDSMVNDTFAGYSPNSEFRVYFNDYPVLETKKLDDVTSILAPAKEEGYDVINLIEAEKGINISIVLYLADEFLLEKEVQFSIDNVRLYLGYTVIRRISLADPAVPPYTFEIDMLGQPPNAISLFIEESPTSGTVRIDTLNDDQGRHVKITKTGGPDRVGLQDRTNFAGSVYDYGVVNFTLLHEDGLFTIRFNGEHGYLIEFDLWDGFIGDYFTNNSFASYSLGEWFDVTVVFDTLRGWHILLNGELIGREFGQAFEQRNPGELTSISWLSSAGEEETGVLRVDNIGYNFARPYVPETPGYELYLLIGMGVLILGFMSYQVHFKYPPMIRKIRKMKRKVAKGKTIKKISVQSRDAAVLALTGQSSALLEQAKQKRHELESKERKIEAEGIIPPEESDLHDLKGRESSKTLQNKGSEIDSESSAFTELPTKPQQETSEAVPEELSQNKTPEVEEYKPESAKSVKEKIDEEEP